MIVQGFDITVQLTIAHELEDCTGGINVNARRVALSQVVLSVECDRKGCAPVVLNLELENGDRPARRGNGPG